MDFTLSVPDMHSPVRLYRVYLYCVVLPLGIVHHAWSALSTCKVTHNTELDDKVSSTWMFKQLTLRVSSSKLDCARLCLINRSCVTFMVNQKSRQCRLHGARITRLNSLVNATGYKSYDTCRGMSKVVLHI
ncbi:uncharacterized protein LOC129928180 [Biomphalaria glabrata]|uniref:Uncharacterized protein LOC129928180 n=1 Tax=Biomphalaria glabrata TaxID=6526 RepID=A0A9W3BCM3_BIOGL|nr:uncharacterized protein LOC129928180 [Biomphalaria glabrata]